MIIVTHEPRELQALADKTLLLSNGKIVQESKN